MPNAIVTGASRGIGVALTKALAAYGFHVDALARDLPAMRAAYADELASARVTCTGLDILDEHAVDSFFASRYANGRLLDLVFNNAGRFVSLSPLWDAEPLSWWSDIEVNVRGTFNMLRAAVPRMMREDRGVIINMGGGRPAGASAYAISKAGVAEMTRALDTELRQVGSKLAVFLADPGLVDTAMTRRHFASTLGPIWVPELVDRVGRGDTRAATEIAEKLIAQLPYMTAQTSGQMFTPDTPTGSFNSIPPQ
jgi:NAD(P)-dependent dehydrogenase (short-subunit alcohol dehydrogenase family)